MSCPLPDGTLRFRWSHIFLDGVEREVIVEVAELDEELDYSLLSVAYGNGRSLSSFDYDDLFESLASNLDFQDRQDGYPTGRSVADVFRAMEVTEL
jgi:hypothetical protein